MGRPNRSDVVSSDEVGVYHCYSRCHNGAFLCGYDEATGQDYEHRRDWIEERQELLAACFAIELLSHIIMSNHMHHVLYDQVYRRSATQVRLTGRSSTDHAAT